MIRGVNRQTIEIREPGNPFFERAILFVTESGTKLSQQQLTAQWNSFLKTSERPPAARAPRPSNAARRKNRRIKSLITAVFWTAVGITISLLFRWIF